MPEKCVHMDQIRSVVPATDGCAECLEKGWDWVQLRVCQVCGHVGCCDSSRGKHATQHFQQTGHAIMKSNEPGQDWRWCYIDKTYV